MKLVLWYIVPERQCHIDDKRFPFIDIPVLFNPNEKPQWKKFCSLPSIKKKGWSAVVNCDLHYVVKRNISSVFNEPDNNVHDLQKNRPETMKKTNKKSLSNLRAAVSRDVWMKHETSRYPSQSVEGCRLVLIFLTFIGKQEKSIILFTDWTFLIWRTSSLNLRQKFNRSSDSKRKRYFL